MRKILALILSLSFFMPSLAVNAAAADRFEVNVNPTAKVGEALDITVKALDKDGKVKKDYNGIIYISVENDTKATTPYETGYEFVAADQGAKTFSKGLIFSKEGKMKVTVFDIDDENLEGSAEVTVGATSTATTPAVTTNEAVTITSPDDGSVVPDAKVNVTGTAKKNSKIQIFLNGKKAGETQTDETGNFLYTVKNLDQDQNAIQAKLLDGTDKIVGESKAVTVSMGSEGPAFKGIVVKEGKTVKSGTVLHLEVSADEKLSEVSASLGDAVEVLKEESAGKYTGTVTAPTASGSYAIDVILKNDLGKVTSKDAVETIEVTALQTTFKNVKAENGDKKIIFTFDLENDSDEISKFQIKYGTGSETLDKEATTYEKSKIKNASGSYSWYVPNLELTKYYFQISALNASGAAIEGVQSEVVESDLSLNSASKCTISNITGIKVVPSNDVSKITWNTLPEAVSYNVYKKDASGKYNLIENVAKNEYIVYLAKDKVQYDDFAIKGVCGEGKDAQESADFAEATRVKTGPAELLILLGLSALIGYFVTRRKFAFFAGK